MMHLNRNAKTLCDQLVERSDLFRVGVSTPGGARVLDLGLEHRGGIAAGLQLASICLGGLAHVDLSPADPQLQGSSTLVNVRTDHPMWSCLGGQYAGWPVQAGKFFAMGSGPMRLLRGREELLTELALSEQPTDVADEPFAAVGVLESDRAPTDDVVAYVAEECGIKPQQLTLCFAPVTSLAGIVQVVARSVETALHKMHAVGMSPQRVISGFGSAPLPPVATDMIGGIGQTNDAILYGGHVTLWVDDDQAVVDDLGPKIPGSSSSDYGRPFADIFKSYDFDFYKVDPGLFSPASITIVNLKTGVTRQFGELRLDVLRKSFGIQP